TVLNPAVVSVSVPLPTVVGGVGILGQVTLDADAPAGGTVVALSSDNPAASVPATVTVAAGTRTASFSVGTVPVTSDRTVILAASAYQTNAATALVVMAPQPKAVTFSPSSVTGGTSSTGTVMLTGIAPAGGWTVTLSSNSGAISIPTTVVVPAGQVSATFTATTSSSIVVTTSATVTASSNGGFTFGSLTVTPIPAALQSVTLSQASLVGGTSTTGTATLDRLSGSNVVVLLSGSGLTAPASVTIPAGQLSASFSVSTPKVSSPTTATLTGTCSGVARSASLLVTPSAAPISLVLNPWSVKGGSSSTGTVTLNAAAPAGGTVVSLSSFKTGVATVASSVTVPAGQTSVSFLVSTKSQKNTQSVTISAKAGGVTQTASLTVTN
ncbi:MAG: hypothetical protein ACKO5K_03620, partial [Armatimonadota bacterium]